MGLDKQGYYSLREILGYGAKYNIILSDRGRGKSFGMKHFLMKQDGEFMCLYRQRPDMKSALQDWIKPLISKDKKDLPVYDPDDFAFDGSDEEGWSMTYQGEVKGYFRCLSEVNRVKQEVFPDTLNWVWLDEFIPLAWKKLQGIESEGDAIRTIVKTIEHDTIRSRTDKGLKEVRVIMIANPFNWNNPILSYFKINGLLGPGIHRAGPGVVWELLEPYEESRKTRKMTVDDFLGNEVNRNMGFINQGAFVAPIPKGAIPYLSMRIRRQFFTIYRFGGSRMWVKGASGHVDIYSQYGGKVLMKFGTVDGLMEDETSLESSAVLERFKRMCFSGKMNFEDINVKFDCRNAISVI